MSPARQTSRTSSATTSSSHSRTASSYHGSTSARTASMSPRGGMPRLARSPVSLIAQGLRLRDVVARLVEIGPHVVAVAAPSAEQPDRHERLDPAGSARVAHVEQIVGLGQRLVPAPEVELQGDLASEDAHEVAVEVVLRRVALGLLQPGVSLDQVEVETGAGRGSLVDPARHLLVVVVERDAQGRFTSSVPRYDTRRAGSG